ncbi:MAG: hypothetical protein HRU18_03625 [Pseudoalteromonas sp.]|uniref:hypothetical protein n=1 Tax=Pseudoalteromonas sp. TaxID=53249 RepID=UPI001D2BD9E3|nr:hypothetical protein [Pseudoalteromonas sp.]NRA77276.1 hypothetical protein [Pseudoalteromonas sp.]
MNKDIDERLLPDGQYSDALNIRVSNTDGADIGALENVLGNAPLTALPNGSVNDVCIGAYEDGSRNDIYWFVKGETRDIVCKYNVITGVLTTLLESTVLGSNVLNFSLDHLITGVNLVVNTDEGNDLLFWTDDINPPRVINVKRFENTPADSFTEDDISVIKKPPIEAPQISFTFEPEASLTVLQDEFIHFAYRYRYIDGELTPVSSFTYCAFEPSDLNVDIDTGENNGMVNSFNAINVDFNTGGKNVTDVELLFKRSGDNNVYRIESFNKEDEGWSDNSVESYTFINDKTYKVLPNDEIFRVYDNVPYLAKAQELIGSRLVYGNYLEGFDIKDSEGNEIDVDFNVEVVSEEVIETEITGIIVVTGNLIIPTGDIPLEKNTNITFQFGLLGVAPNDGTFSGNLSFILNRDYATAEELFTSDEFKVDFIEGAYTSLFNTTSTVTPPIDGEVVSETSFTSVFDSNTGELAIVPPTITYEIDPTPLDPNSGDETTEVYEFDFVTPPTSNVFVSSSGSNQSVKTNRSYELGLIYIDDYGRRSTVLTCEDNTVSVPQSLSEFKNTLKVNISSEAPANINKYKLAIKQDRGNYYNIFGTTFFEDGSFVWVKLEGSNKDKVAVGDTLIVKRDSSSLRDEPIETTVLAIESKGSNFIENNWFDINTGNIVPIPDNPDNPPEGIVEIIEGEGVYMKIKPTGFNMNFNGNAIFIDAYVDFVDFEGFKARANVDAKRSDGSYFPISSGSVISLNLYTVRERSSSPRFARGSYRYVATADYESFYDFWLAEVGLAPLEPDTIGSGLPQDSVFDVVNSQEDYGIPKSIGFESIDTADGNKRRTITMQAELLIRNASGFAVFETKPDLNQDEVYYETSETFEIINGEHQSTPLYTGVSVGQDQILNVQDAEVELGWFNCYTMGEGVESMYYKDSFNKPFLAIDLNPTTTSVERFSAVRRYSNLTYSEPYNEESGINGLNEFNLSKANYKDDMNKREGSIQKLFAKDTDLMVFQEDKVSKVLFGKDVLFNADGTSNVSSVENVLGQHIPYLGEFGISFNPESFSIYANNIVFIDAKRGSVLRLGNNGITEVSNIGMRTFFRDELLNNISINKYTAYDPYHDQYIIHMKSNEDKTVVFDDKVKGWTSFMSYSPDWMIGMNNRFYSFKFGNLYVHDSEQVPRDNFYGVQYDSTVSLMFNNNPSDIKLIKAVSIEGSEAWDADITAFVSNTDDVISSSLTKDEFVKKEGIFYTYTRRNEDPLQEDSKAIYGIGVVTDINGLEIEVNGFNSSLTQGDDIRNGTDLSLVGTVQSSNTIDGITTIILDTVTGLAQGDFIVGTKDARLEGGNLRGYTIKFDLTNNTNDKKVELFAINVEAMKSYS